MSMKLCPIQELCPKFEAGRHPSNNDVRHKIPCKLFLDMSCEMGVSLELWLGEGEGISCNIEKMNRLRKK